MTVKVWFAEYQAPKTVHDVVEEVLRNHHFQHEFCIVCGMCMVCDTPHACTIAKAKAA